MMSDILMEKPSESKKWTVAFIFSFVFLFPVAWYVHALMGTLSTLSAWTAITAGVASLLLAVAFSASSFNYFFGWPDMRLGYQKQIGVLAFWLSCLYCVFIAIISPEIYVTGFFENFFTADIILGLSAMIIFAAMTGINSSWVAPRVSWDTIKFVLGLGFIGYGLLVVRAIFLEWPLWQAWLTSFEGLPTTRFVLSMIAIVVLLMRVGVILHRKTHPKPKVV